MNKSLRLLLIITFIPMWYSINFGQSTINDTLFPVKGFAIGAPDAKEVDRFIKFIHDDLGPRKVTHLLLRVDYKYEYTSHPELRDSNALTYKDAKALVAACKAHGIEILPQVNLLGHQSWHSKTTRLLTIYPQFDETPHVKMPEVYKWPNPDGLYCKSYCPLHPEVHAIVFDLMDEICDVFEAKAFHAGMDEVFYIGDDKCPRCSGVDKAELFAGEVNTLRNHLALKNRELWIWGDRLIDGKSTGMGMWEASMNNTARAVDLIAKDVVICDWHYERPDQSPVYFAMKGLRVITCPWNKPPIAIAQVEDMARWRQSATKAMKPRYYGMMQTVWSGPSGFMDNFYNINPVPADRGNPAATFKALFDRMKDMERIR